MPPLTKGYGKISTVLSWPEFCQGGAPEQKCCRSPLFFVSCRSTISFVSGTSMGGGSSGAVVVLVKKLCGSGAHFGSFRLASQRVT
jgi:hypothetical protein